MFERFLAEFVVSPSGESARGFWQDSRLMAVEGYRELAGRFAGCSFNDGLYRLHDADSGPFALGLVAETFPEFANRLCPFGFDWLGRQFCLDAGRVENGQSLVMLLEPGTGEALEIPVSFEQLHDEELVEYHDAALASGFFAEWAAGHQAELPLPAGQCVGYRVPLFLGGDDIIDNLEKIDLGVYWSVCGQLRRGAMNLPPGTSISSIVVR